MFLYVFAKYLVYKQPHDYEISMEIIFSILTISILLSVTRKFWYWFHEYNNTNTETIKMHELYYDQEGKVFNADECPICVSQPVNAIKTNCGHCFCGPCFQQFFNVTQISPNRYKCPLCRQIISNIQRSNKDIDKESTSDEEKIDNFLKEYHDQFNRHKRTANFGNIAPWLFNLFIGSLFLITILSPFLYTSVKRIIIEFYAISQNFVAYPYNNPNDERTLTHM